jgi:hypothetical protein
MTPAAASPAASAIDSQTAMRVAFRCGNKVVAMSVPDSMSRVAMMKVARALSQRGLTQGPSTSVSLHSSSRNTLALGSSSPARECSTPNMSPKA